MTITQDHSTAQVPDVSHGSIVRILEVQMSDREHFVGGIGRVIASGMADGQPFINIRLGEHDLEQVVTAMQWEVLVDALSDSPRRYTLVSHGVTGSGGNDLSAGSLVRVISPLSGDRSWTIGRTGEARTCGDLCVIVDLKDPDSGLMRGVHCDRWEVIAVPVATLRAAEEPPIVGPFGAPDVPEGTRIRAVRVRGVTRMEGLEGTVLRHQPDDVRGTGFSESALQGSNGVYCRFDNGDAWYVEQWQVLAEAPVAVETPVVETPVEEPVAPVAPIDGTQTPEYRELLSKYAQSIDIINARIGDEANDRGWCSDYERVLEEVNRELQSIGSPFEMVGRQREYRVSWSEDYTITVTRSTVVTAGSESEAEGIARS